MRFSNVMSSSGIRGSVVLSRAAEIRPASGSLGSQLGYQGQVFATTGLELPTSRLSGLRSASDPFRIKPVILRQTRIPKGVGAGSLPVSNHLDPAGYRSQQRNEQRKRRGRGGAAPQRRSKHLQTLGGVSPLPQPVDSCRGPRLMAEAPQQPHGKTSRDA